MRGITWALLVGTAMTVTVARADDLNALISEIEALQNLASQPQAQPQAFMSSDYSLVSISGGQGTYEGVLPERNADMVREDSGFTLSVLPMADATPVAEFSVSGEIRNAVIYTDDSLGSDPHRSFVDDFSHDRVDMKVRGRISVKGKVDTAVGEVGGYISLQTDGGGNFLD